jgi:quercetin dioxygenase-like cupin family protein
MTQAKKKSSTTSPLNRTKASAIALKGTVGKGKPPKSQMRHISWSAVEVEQVNPLLGRQLVVGQNIMVTRIHLKKGCIVPEHSHPNEQVSYITDGALKFWIDGREIVVAAGEVLTIPPNLPHKAEALADTVSVDIFDPPRADWIEKTDAYLR